MRKTRILALIMALSVIFSMFSFQTVSADVFNEKYQTEIDFLKIMELVESDYDATLVITKGEIAMMVLNVLYPEMDFSNSATGTQVFSDVPKNHACYSYIQACKGLGIVKGNADSKFEPDKQITLAEALTMIINSLGYAHHAEAMGGYPTGYYMVANQIGILKGIKLSVTDAVSGGDAVRLIYNSLFASIVEMASIENGSVELKINNGVSVLNQRFSVYEYDGVIIDNGISSIDGTSIGDANRAVLKSSQSGGLVKAYVNGTNVSEFLGMRVKAYIRNNEEEGRYEFVHVIPHSSMEVITVNAKDIIYTSQTYVEYDEDLETAEFEKINFPAPPVVIFNGVQIVGKELRDIMPKDGFVKFIDKEGDNNTDVISIFSMNYQKGSFTADARNIVVDRVVTTKDEEGISCVFNPSVSVDLHEDEYIYSFVLNSEYKSLEDVKSGMVVSVFEAPEKIDGKTYYMLAVNKYSTDGSVSAVEGTNRVYFNDNEYYDISSSFTGTKPNFLKGLKTGANVSLVFDITGKAAFVKTETEATKDYGYIVKAVAKNQGTDYALVKFFSKDGKMYTLPLADNAVIDGVRTTNMSAQAKIDLIEKRYDKTDEKISTSDKPGILKDAEKTGRPAIIKVSKEKIINIDTDTPNIDPESGQLSMFYEHQSIIKYTTEEAENYDALKAGFRSPRAVTVSGTNKTVGGKYFITSNTVIINVPEIDTYALRTYMGEYRPYGYTGPYLRGTGFTPDDKMIKLYEDENVDENYKLMKLSQMYSTYSMDLQAYDIDPDTGIAGLVVVRGRTDMYRASNVPNATPMAVFIKTTLAYDETLEKQVTKVHYYENGEIKSATIDLDSCYYPYKALINGYYKTAGDKNAEIPHAYTVEEEYIVTDKNGEILKDDKGKEIKKTKSVEKDIKVNPLTNGDIIRVVQSGGKITHIERVRELDNFKNDEVYGFVGFSRGVTVPYGTSTSGSRSNFPFNTPIIDEDDDYSYSSNNAIGTMYVQKIKGNTIQLACVKEYETKFSSIDFDNWTTYSSLFATTGKLAITVLTIPEDGGDVEVREGTIDDITTLEEVNYDTSKASIIMSKMASLEPTETIVINGIENLR